MTFCSRRRHSVQPHWQHGWGIRDPIFFHRSRRLGLFHGPRGGGIDGEWKMSATDLIFTPIGCQRSELCSNLCSGDRFWPFYNFQFFGGREFIFPSVIPIRSRRKTKLSCFHRSRRLGLFQGPRGGESTGNGK